MENIINSAADVLAKQRSSKNIAYNSCALIVSFLIVFVADLMVADNKSSLYMMLVTAGSISALIFLGKMFFGNKKLIYTPTKSMVKEYSLFFDSGELQNLIYAIETGNMSVTKRTVDGKNSAIRLDVVISEDEKFASCQIFKYVPYNYEVASVVYRIPNQQLSTFCSGIKQMSREQEK